MIFNVETRDSIIDAAVSAGYAPAATRTLLLADINPVYHAMLTLPGLNDLLQLNYDVSKMNDDEIIADGSVPLRSWLRQAIRFVQKPDAKLVFEKAVNDLNRKLSGQPPVDLPATARERKEAIVFQDDMVPFGFLGLGEKAGMSVACLEVPRYDGGDRAKSPAGEDIVVRGTGWLIAPNLILTNHHVVNCREDTGGATLKAPKADLLKQVAGTVVRFDFNEKGQKGKEIADPTLEASDEKLDYAVLRVEDAGAKRAPLLLAPDRVKSPAPGKFFAVNIIQHPDGGPKKVAVRNNLVTEASTDDVRYFTDTDFGSSGSPVFDDQWRVVGLHRGTLLVSEGIQFQGKTSGYVNVGTQIQSVLASLKKRFKSLHDEIVSGKSAAQSAG